MKTVQAGGKATECRPGADSRGLLTGYFLGNLIITGLLYRHRHGAGFQCRVTRYPPGRKITDCP